MEWAFNGNYDDYEQVEQFYPMFKKLHDEIIEKGGFPYNSLFEGKFNIEDNKQEKTAIYLLQQSETEKMRQAKIINLLADGFQHIEKVDKPTKFKKIVQVGTDYSRASTKEYDNAKIFSENGKSLFILPKGHSRTGYRIYSDESIFAK
jgi:hypothetical protein